MKSKTKIEKQLSKKTNPSLVETVKEAKKHEAWMGVAGNLSTPRRNRAEMNLTQINENSKDNETLVIPGKVLSQGEITKKIKIVALNFSETAKAKLLKTKTSFNSILEEIKQNPSAKGIKILK